mgnify:CR=1 FL=1
MTRTSLSLFNKLRPYSIGFDNAFDQWDRFFTDDFNLTSAVTSSFPAYDIIKKNDHQYQIQLALAGFCKVIEMFLSLYVPPYKASYS